MNTQEKIEALEVEFNERLKALKVEVHQEQEFPQDGDKYWCIDDEGGVLNSTYDSHYIDMNRQIIGNFFQTGEQADFAVKKLKVEVELNKFGRPFEKDEKNCFIQIDSSHDSIVIDDDEGYQTQGTIYFESEEKALQAIDSIGEERIKKYIFGVGV